MNGSHISAIISGVLITLIYFMANKSSRKSEQIMDENNFTVRQPKIFLWTGIITSLIFVVFIVGYTGSIIDKQEGVFESRFLWAYGFFISCLFLCLLVIHGYCRYKLEINGDTVTYTPRYFGKKKTFNIKQIASYEINKTTDSNDEKITVYSKSEKLFFVPSSYSGYKLFVSRLKKEIDLKNAKNGIH